MFMFQEMWLHGLYHLLQWEKIYLNSDILKILKEEVQVRWKIKHGSRDVTDIEDSSLWWVPENFFLLGQMI